MRPFRQIELPCAQLSCCSRQKYRRYRSPNLAVTLRRPMPRRLGRVSISPIRMPTEATSTNATSKNSGPAAICATVFFGLGPSRRRSKAPKHDTCRQQFDPAVPTKREERWTVRSPCADTGNHEFHKHPENCEQLNRADAVQGVSVRMGFGN